MQIYLFQVSTASTVLAAAPGFPAQPQEFAMGWFDFVVIIVLILGFIRGRKRGMSQEILDLTQWLCIVGLGAFLYKPLGGELSRMASMNLAYSYVVSYAGLALAVKLVVSLIKHRLGEKLASSDTFGRIEYYLGMMAGATRFGCVLLMVLAFLHAPHYTEADRIAENKKQADSFSDIRFPTFASVQNDVFAGSFTGQWLRENASFLLIESVVDTRSKREGIGQQRQREVESIFNR